MHANQTAYPSTRCVSELFESEARRTPQAIAVVLASGSGAGIEAPAAALTSLTYWQLNQRANQLARFIQKLGVKRTTPVGVFMERTPEILVALLGILKAGGVLRALWI